MNFRHNNSLSAVLADFNSGTSCVGVVVLPHVSPSGIRSIEARDARRRIRRNLNCEQIDDVTSSSVHLRPASGAQWGAIGGRSRRRRRGAVRVSMCDLSVKKTKQGPAIPLAFSRNSFRERGQGRPQTDALLFSNLSNAPRWYARYRYSPRVSPRVSKSKRERISVHLHQRCEISQREFLARPWSRCTRARVMSPS